MSEENITVQEQPEEKKRLGPYVFQKTLGQGTFGKVKLATHTPTGQHVAIKILEKAKIADVSDIERVSREIHILKLVRHPNIIQLYEIIETKKYLFLVMEHCPGGELFDYIAKNEKLEQKQACKYFHQIVQGLEYLHGLNIVHRDLKPENMLLDWKGNIKIVDFGLSNTYSKDLGQEGKLIEEKLKTACGSPCYAAPQMIAGKRYNGLKVDIWSSGVILFAMLTGNLPFEDPNTSHLYKKILALNYKIPNELTTEARSIIKGLLTVCEKRLSLEQIKVHPFYKLVNLNGGIGIRVGIDQIPHDNMLIDELINQGYEKDYMRKCVETNRHNGASTAYHLLLKKKLKEGFHSHADINSDKFDPALLKQVVTKNRPKSRSEMRNFIDSQIEMPQNKSTQKARPNRSFGKTPTPSGRYSRVSQSNGRSSRLNSSLEKAQADKSLSGIRMSMEGKLLLLPDISRIAKRQVKLY